jgi:hypothetical protein
LLEPIVEQQWDPRVPAVQQWHLRTQQQLPKALLKDMDAQQWFGISSARLAQDIRMIWDKMSAKLM